MNEAETRAEHIDPALQAAGWGDSKGLENGFGLEQMTEMQRIIDAEKSDLFDVLAYVAYALPTLTREQRATTAPGVRFGKRPIPKFVRRRVLRQLALGPTPRNNIGPTRWGRNLDGPISAGGADTLPSCQ